MPKLYVTQRSGAQRSLDIASGPSLMEALRSNGFDEVLAICGGCCCCATCHIFVDDAFVNRLPEMSKDEKDLLDTLGHRKANSRLSCQLSVDDTLDGLHVVIASDE
jgi:ferredoxin, 2Fe-2S